MDYLVYCPCGHTVDRHGDVGCTGDRSTTCDCTRMPAEAVTAAVDEVRTRQWAVEPADETDVPLTFEEFVTTVLQRIRQRLPDAQLCCERGTVVCRWGGGSLEARPVSPTECLLSAHSHRLKLSAQASFKLRSGATRVAAEFALLLRSRPPSVA